MQATNKELNYRTKDVRQTHQQRPGSPTVTLIWHVSKYKVHTLHQRYILKFPTGTKFEDEPLVEFMYLVFTCMPCESSRRRPRSLLCLCVVFRVLLNRLFAESADTKISKTADPKATRDHSKTIKLKPFLEVAFLCDVTSRGTYVELLQLLLAVDDVKVWNDASTSIKVRGATWLALGVRSPVTPSLVLRML